MAPFTPHAMSRQRTDAPQSGTLWHSAAEADAIVRSTGAQYLLDQACTAQAYRQVLRTADLLHLATHGTADYEEPELSYLQLADGERVYAYEIQAQPNKLALLGLSACETAAGQTYPGEGALSLARAYMTGGAEAIVATLWPVNDQATAEIMETFYRNLRRGYRKDKALHLAKQRYLTATEGPGQHPYYWAGFVLIGSTKPLQFGPPVWPWLILSTVALALLGAWLYRRRMSV